MSRKYSFLLLLLMAVFLAACSTNQAPRLIGSYPSTPPRLEPPLHSEIHICLHIALHLRQAQTTLSSFKTVYWRMLHTLQNAFDLYVSMINFLIMILIWLIVLVSPIALISWLIYRATQRKPN
jgi:hypothetical protein